MYLSHTIKSHQVPQPQLIPNPSILQFLAKSFAKMQIIAI
jgi:hypothetical protein